jgi:hypothetical protein
MPPYTEITYCLQPTHHLYTIQPITPAQHTVKKVVAYHSLAARSGLGVGVGVKVGVRVRVKLGLGLD